MRRLTSILFVITLAVAGSSFAQTTSATASAQGTYPAGSTFNGINLSALQLATGTLIGSDGTAEGQLTVALIGTTALGLKQTINIEAAATGGSNTTANVATITGSCSVDMGDGTPPLTGVPFVATITTNDQHLGTLGLVLGSTALPTATINNGSLSIEKLE